MNAQAPIVQQAVAQLHQGQIRVTSIPYTSSSMVIFSDVPLAKHSYKTNSGKYHVTIKTDPDTIPTQPTLGQHWSVKGTRLVKEIETGDFVMQQHTYESPEHIECSLLETGEQLIRVIASVVLYGIIETPKANYLDLFEYMRTCVDEVSTPLQLLPWQVR